MFFVWERALEKCWYADEAINTNCNYSRSNLVLEGVPLYEIMMLFAQRKEQARRGKESGPDEGPETVREVRAQRMKRAGDSQR